MNCDCYLTVGQDGHLEKLSLTGQFIAGKSYTPILQNPLSWRFLTQLDKTTLTSSSVGRKILLLAVILD